MNQKTSPRFSEDIHPIIREIPAVIVVVKIVKDTAEESC